MKRRMKGTVKAIETRSKPFRKRLAAARDAVLVGAVGQVTREHHIDHDATAPQVTGRQHVAIALRILAEQHLKAANIGLGMPLYGL